MIDFFMIMRPECKRIVFLPVENHHDNTIQDVLAQLDWILHFK